MQLSASVRLLRVFTAERVCQSVCALFVQSTVLTRVVSVSRCFFSFSLLRY